MKKIFIAAFIALTGIGISKTAKADLLVEPLVGWSVNQSLSFNPGEDYSSGNGISYGGRLGWQEAGLQLGLDYLNSSIEMGSNDFKRHLDTEEWAAFVGYEFPILFRIYGGWIFFAEGDSNLNRANLQLEDGMGGKIGVGFTLLPFLDLNFEYRRGEYDTAKVGNLKFDGNEFEAVLFSVSMPLQFFK